MDDNLFGSFVHNGGGYVGICAGAFLATHAGGWSLGVIGRASALWRRERDSWLGEKFLTTCTPRGIVELAWTEAGTKCFPAFPARLNVLYSGGPIFLKAETKNLPPYTAIATYGTEVRMFEFQRGTMSGTPAIIVDRFGKGNVVAISPHIESTEGLDAVVRMVVRWAANGVSGVR